MLKRLFKKRYDNSEIDPEDIFLDSSNISNLEVEKMEGTIGKPISESSSNLVFIFIVLIFLIFLFQLYSLQIKNHSYYLDISDDNRINSTIIFAPRGQIFDRLGTPLAYNVATSSSEGYLKREYIKHEGFSNLLGYLNYPKSDKSGNYWQKEYIGKDGIELYYDKLLNGKNGQKVISRDVSLKIEDDNIISPPVPGQNLTLTIDADLQKELFNSIKNVVNNRGYVSGVGILMNINNGEILAMANYPEYDNNLLTNPEGAEDSKKISALLVDKRTPFLNRAVSGLFTPGSVVKPFMAYAALNEGVITPEKKINSVGAITIKNIYGGPDTVFKDWKVHGWVDAVTAIAQSSDEYFYQVGGGYQNQKGIGINKIDEYAKMFGLSTSTGIDLPNEAVGVIPTPDWKRINFIDGEWRLGNTYHTSIGQYGFQVTPLELIRYISSIANDGFLVTPHMLLNSEASLSKIDLNLNKDHLYYVKEGMKRAVMPGGTEPQLNISGLKIAAKSGTAELGIKKLTVNSLIAGYFPYDKPKYAFVIIMENGNIGNRSGSVQAAIPFLTYFRDSKSEYLK